MDDVELPRRFGWAVALGIDGESVRMEPPIVFETLPLALRVRTSVRRDRRLPGRRRLPTQS